MNVKKIFICVTMMVVAVAFASAITDTRAQLVNDVPSPASKTAGSTAGTIGTDVDAYLDVYGWGGVDFKKGFAFVDYSFQGNRFNAGYATKVAGNYLGLWFAGNGADFDNLTQTFSDDNKGNKASLFNGNGPSYALSALYGLGKGMAVKASMFYRPSTISHISQKDVKYGNETINPKNNVDIYNLNTDLTFAFGDLVSIGSGKTLSKLKASLGLDIYNAKNTTRIGYTDNSFSDLYIRGGADVFGWDMQLDTRWRIFPSTISDVTIKTDNTTTQTKTIVEGASDNLIAFTAKRSFELTAAEGKLLLCAQPVLPLHIGFLSEQDGSKTGTADWVYAATRKSETDIVFVPELNLGAQYKLAPGKVDVNVGSNFALGTVGWNIVKTSHRDDTATKSVTWSDTVTDFGWASTNMRINWQSGFAIHFGPDVTLDCAYNVLGRVLNNMSTNPGAFVDNGDKFWGTIGNVVFNTTINMQLAIKF